MKEDNGIDALPSYIMYPYTGQEVVITPEFYENPKEESYEKISGDSNNPTLFQHPIII